MGEVIARAWVWLGANSNAAQAVSAILGVTVIVISAIAYIKNIAYDRREKQLNSQQHVLALYRDWLKVCAEQSDLRVPFGSPIAATELTPAELNRRDALFDMLTCMLEEVYLTYKNPTETLRQTSFDGWVEFLHVQLKRQDYLEWYHRICLEGDARNLETAGWSGYEYGFENDMLAPALRNHVSTLRAFDKPRSPTSVAASD